MKGSYFAIMLLSIATVLVAVAHCQPPDGPKTPLQQLRDREASLTAALKDARDKMESAPATTLRDAMEKEVDSLQQELHSVTTKIKNFGEEKHQEGKKETDEKQKGFDEAWNKLAYVRRKADEVRRQAAEVRRNAAEVRRRAGQSTAEDMAGGSEGSSKESGNKKPQNIHIGKNYVNETFTFGESQEHWGGADSGGAHAGWPLHPDFQSFLDEFQDLFQPNFGKGGSSKRTPKPVREGYVQVAPGVFLGKESADKANVTEGNIYTGNTYTVNGKRVTKEEFLKNLQN